MSNVAIGEKRLHLPLIQGGMGVGVSLSRLAGHVAKCGGMGVISSAQIGFRESDFAYHTKPEKGEVSAEVNKQDNSITWTISKLDYGETATFTYRLKLKDSFDGDIIAKNLKTNKNVTINYKENGKDGEPKENDKCPVVILDVLPSNPIPKTGTNTFIISTLTISGVVIAIVSIIKFKKV